MSKLKYRNDIDGLRALSVFMVVIFHANPIWLSGGFIGVDIFFVISGFIITNAIYPQILERRFSFNNFYIKRIKRILPLFYLVAITSTIMAYILFMPSDLASFGDSLRYASVFISNIYFEKNSGYFAPSSDTLPLLHTWSLAIEEQYYLLWPIILLGCVKYLGHRTKYSLFTISFIALVLTSHFITKSDPELGYYTIQSRAFELLIGALLSTFLIDNKETIKVIPNAAYNALGYISLGTLIILAIVYTEDILFPGINAFWVVLMAALLIFSGTNPNSHIHSILGNKLFAYFGRLSYSLYLWHWPVLAFYRYYHNNFSSSDAILCIVIAIFLSVASLHLYENKLRYAKLKIRYVYGIYLVLPIVTYVMMAQYLANHDGIPSRFPESTQALFEQTSYTIDDYKEVQDKNYKANWIEPFTYGAQNQNVSAVIWGDSHANRYIGTVEEISKEFDFSFVYGGRGGCPPVIGAETIRHGVVNKDCTNQNNGILEDILSSSADIVFLASRWGMYAETTKAVGESGSRVYLGTEDNYEESIQNSRKSLEQGLSNTINILNKNSKKVVLLNQVPVYPFKPSNCWIKKHTYKSMESINCNQTHQAMTQRFNSANEILTKIVSKYPNTLLIDVQSLLCNAEECHSKLGETPIYSDNNHLNYLGSKKLYEQLKESDQFIELKQLLLNHHEKTQSSMG